MSHWQIAHLDAVFYILKYINFFANYGLFYAKDDIKPLQGFTNVDWASCTESQKSVGGYCFILAGFAVTWQSKQQPIVSKSSTESEYISLSIGVSEATWLYQLLQELDFDSKPPSWISLSFSNDKIDSNLAIFRPISIYCDNQSTNKLAKNLVFHARTKHIEVHHHFIWDKLLRGEICLNYISTDDQLIDIFTKALPRIKFEQHRGALGIIPVTYKSLG